MEPNRSRPCCAASAVAPQHGRDLHAAHVRSALPSGQIVGGVGEAVRQLAAQQRAHVRIMEECEGLLLYGEDLGARFAPDRLRRCAAQQVQRAEQHDEQRSQWKSSHARRESVAANLAGELASARCERSCDQRCVGFSIGVRSLAVK